MRQTSAARRLFVAMIFFSFVCPAVYADTPGSSVRTLYGSMSLRTTEAPFRSTILMLVID